jgi:hypothetical protein
MELQPESASGCFQFSRYGLSVGIGRIDKQGGFFAGATV